MINIFQYGYASWTNVTQIALSCEGTRLDVQAFNGSKEILINPRVTYILDKKVHTYTL